MPFVVAEQSRTELLQGRRDDRDRRGGYAMQGERTTAGGMQGSGLGIAIAKEIVLQHGGRIWAESALGQGSRFSFSLPVFDPNKP
nr:ATP-binding protein [Paenibacillus piri]